MEAPNENTKPSSPVKVFYQEAKDDDIDKYNRESNNAKTGGGARDLRIRPSNRYWDLLKEFFPERIDDRNYSGRILTFQNNVVDEAIISLMAPTPSRPNECRITKFYLIKGWNISREDFATKTKLGYKWFYLLILDDNGHVWASKFCTDIIGKMAAAIRLAILTELERNTGQTIRNIVEIKKNDNGA